MPMIDGPPKKAIRNQPITGELKQILLQAGSSAGIDGIVIVSGGQTSHHAPHLKNVAGGWTGSRRHDNGRAADLKLVRNGKVLTFTDKSGGATVEAFVTAAAAAGATGIGAGVAYMGNDTLHVGFGNSAGDTAKLVWGAGGKSATAPAWLKAAAAKGWTAPDPAAAAFDLPSPPAGLPDRFVVTARRGLRLRNGPGRAFDAIKELEAGTELTVVGFDGPNGEWARVDLEDDGLIDGHASAAYLKPASGVAGGSEEVAEPDDGEDASGA